MRLTGRDRDRALGRRRAASWRKRSVLGFLSGPTPGAALAVLLAFGVPAAPGEPSEPAPTRIAPIALKGYDPVSYFLPEGPQPGSPRFETDWDGRVWRFAMEANRAAFRRDPDVYAPRLGGFDAQAILERRLADADPTLFALIDGRLYLFRDGARRARFVADPALAREAETIWPTLGDMLDDPEDFRAAKPPAASPKTRAQ